MNDFTEIPEDGEGFDLNALAVQFSGRNNKSIRLEIERIELKLKGYETDPRNIIYECASEFRIPLKSVTEEHKQNMIETVKERLVMLLAFAFHRQKNKEVQTERRREYLKNWLREHRSTKDKITSKKKDKITGILTVAAAENTNQPSPEAVDNRLEYRKKQLSLKYLERQYNYEPTNENYIPNGHTILYEETFIRMRLQGFEYKYNHQQRILYRVSDKFPDRVFDSWPVDETPTTWIGEYETSQRLKAADGCFLIFVDEKEEEIYERWNREDKERDEKLAAIMRQQRIQIDKTMQDINERAAAGKLAKLPDMDAAYEKDRQAREEEYKKHNS